MKKLIGALFLLLVLLAVSYFKVVREDSAQTQVYQEGLQQGSENRAAMVEVADSFAEVIDSYEVTLSDSQRIWEQRNLAIGDSLGEEIAHRDDRIASLTHKQRDLEKQLASAEKKATSNTPKKYTHQEILAYYKKKYKALPPDLSPYEKRIALAEIREESARKFSITVSELNKIRESNNLAY